MLKGVDNGGRAFKVLEGSKNYQGCLDILNLDYVGSGQLGLEIRITDSIIPGLDFTCLVHCLEPSAETSVFQIFLLLQGETSAESLEV